MIIHKDVEQGSLEWLRLRMGKVTASELSNLVTPEFKIKTGAGPHTYLCQKAAEAYRGTPMMGFQSWQMERGIDLEGEARGYLAFEANIKVKQVAFVESADGKSGASPDGLIGEDGGIEIKCPEPHTHVKYLLDGELPKDYAPQVHGCMFVTGRPWWKFLSYCPKFPPFLITVERDEEKCKIIGNAIQAFSTKFTAAMARLKSA